MQRNLRVRFAKYLPHRPNFMKSQQGPSVRALL